MRVLLLRDLVLEGRIGFPVLGVPRVCLVELVYYVVNGCNLALVLGFDLVLFAGNVCVEIFVVAEADLAVAVVCLRLRHRYDVARLPKDPFQFAPHFDLGNFELAT